MHPFHPFHPLQPLSLPQVPLHIPGLASTDSYYSLGEPETKEARRKKKRKKARKEASSESDEASGPNVFVSCSVEVPEGASVSDLDRTDTDDGSDPHRALGNINLEDFLDPPAAQVKAKKTKKSKSEDLAVSPGLVVEQKTHKKKKDKKKKSKSEKTNHEADLLGLSVEATGPGCGAVEEVLSCPSVSVVVDTASCRVVAGALSCSLSVTNTSSSKLSGVRVATSSASSPATLAKSLKPGVTKSKVVSLPVGEGRPGALEVVVSWEGAEGEECSLPLPATAWLLAPHPALDMEGFAELLLSGELVHSEAAALAAPYPGLAPRLANALGLALVEEQEGAASLYAEAADGARVAFLLKGAAGGATLEGRSGERALLEGLLAMAGKV